MNTIYTVAGIAYSAELYHHGIKGQKWGIRRFQNPDGTLTPEGKARYGTDLERMAAKDAQRYSDAQAAYGRGAGTRRKLIDQELSQKKKDPEYKKAYDEASKYVSNKKSIKKAERLYKNRGLFNRGADLSDRGKTYLKVGLDNFKNLAVSQISLLAMSKTAHELGAEAVSGMLLYAMPIAALGTLGKGAYDMGSLAYYNKNRKF